MLEDFLISKYDKTSQLVLWGAGDNGVKIAHSLERMGIGAFVFCDEKKNSEVEGHEVIDPSSLARYDKKQIIIASGKWCVEIYQNIKKLQIDDENIFLANTLYLNSIKNETLNTLEDVGKKYSYLIETQRLRAYLSGGWYIENLIILFTERCSLNCKYCNNLMPFYQKPKDYDVDTICFGFQKLLESGCHIGVLDIIGGEPLMNQNVICSFMETYGNHSQIGGFQMITNGTIVPEHETVECFRKAKQAFVIFSNYGALSRNQEKAVMAFQEGGVDVYSERNEDISASNGTLWIDYGEVKHYDCSPEKYQRMYDRCMDGKKCTTMLNGRLYICPRIANGVNLGLIPAELENTFYDFNELDFAKKSKAQIVQECKNFLYPTTYPAACEYCDRDSGKLGERAEQVKRIRS